jgi:hypothetical protein
MIGEPKPDMGSPKTPEEQKHADVMTVVDRINNLSTEDIKEVAENLRRIIEERQQNNPKENEAE